MFTPIDPDDEDSTSDEDDNISKSSAAAATPGTTKIANPSTSDAVCSENFRSFESGSGLDDKKVPGKSQPDSDDEESSDGGNTIDDKKVPAVRPHLKSSRGKIVYVPSRLQPPAYNDDINYTRSLGRRILWL